MLSLHYHIIFLFLQCFCDIGKMCYLCGVMVVLAAWSRCLQDIKRESGEKPEQYPLL